MSFEDFGAIIALHGVLRDRLADVVNNRGVMNLEFDLRTDVFKLASTLFGVPLNTFADLLTEAQHFHAAFVDWMEDRNRALAQLTHEWALGTTTITNDVLFVQTYIRDPLHAVHGVTRSAVMMMAASNPSVRELNFRDMVSTVSMYRDGRYTAIDGYEMPPVALLSRNDNLNIPATASVANANFVGGAWADHDTLWLVGRYTGNNQLTFENVSELLNHTIATSVTISFTTSVAGTAIHGCSIPTGGRLTVGGEATSPRYPINRMIDLGLKLSTNMTIQLDANHGVEVGSRVAIAIKGKFILKTCGIRRLFTNESMRTSQTVGYCNFGAGSTIMTTRESCNTNTQSVMLRLYNNIYARLMEAARPNIGTTGYLLIGDSHQPSLTLYSLFGGAPPADNPLGVDERRDVAFTMIRAGFALNGLSLYSGL